MGFSMADEVRAKRQDIDFDLCDAVKLMFRQIGQKYVDISQPSTSPAPVPAQPEAHSDRSAA